MKQCKWMPTLYLVLTMAMLSGCNPAMDEVAPHQFALWDADVSNDVSTRPPRVCGPSSGHRTD